MLIDTMEDVITPDETAIRNLIAGNVLRKGTDCINPHSVHIFDEEVNEVGLLWEKPDEVRH
jgi:hypothetical protein